MGAIGAGFFPPQFTGIDLDPAAAFVVLPIVVTGFTVARWEAGLFLAYYAAYVAYLLLDSAGHDALPRFSAVMLWFVLPLSALTLVVLATYELGVRRRSDLGEPSPRRTPRR